jgi:hypothetical protein
MSTPYAVSSDLVSAYPAKSLAIAQFIDGYKTSLAMVQNAQTGTSYTLALADFTKLVTLNNAAAVAVTLPLEATVAWETGTQLRLLNIGAGTVTVAGAVGVTINGTPLTLAQYKGANLIKTGTNTWVFIPFASGVGAAVFSDTPTGTYTGFAYKTFTASSTLTVTTAGFADVVIVAGGGASIGASGNGAGGGGAGGAIVQTVYLPVGTLTCTVGAGGAFGTAGNLSRIGDFYYAVGGSAAVDRATLVYSGGCGAGGSANPGYAGGAATTGQGFAGGTGNGSNPTSSGGGGGGVAAVGANASGGTAGAGGAGTTTSIAGTTPSGAYVAGSYSYGGGGGGGGSAAGGTATSGGGAGSTVTGSSATANKGGGGGGSYATAGTPAGGSGIIIVRVAV